MSYETTITRDLEPGEYSLPVVLEVFAFEVMPVADVLRS